MITKQSVLCFVTYLLTTTSAQWFSQYAYEQSGGSFQCSFSDWTCNDGSCIQRSSVCDGIQDCPDGADEAIHMCPRSRFSCPQDSFNCGDTCIDSRLACNGQRDCTNGYDESDTVCRRKPDCLPPPTIENGFMDINVKNDFDKTAAEQDRLTFTVRCNARYSLGKGTLRCINGTWTGVAPLCVECGKTTPSPRRVTPEGDTYQYGVAPWHVGVYSKLKKPQKLICGGSLISAQLILSAAQCFWDDAIGLLPAPIFAVAAGKAFGGWEDDRDYNAQTSDVDEIKVPELFLGETNNLMHNIAFVTLASSFEFTSYVSPVCLDFDSLLFHGFDEIADNMVAIWRRSSSNENLQVSDFVNVKSCGTDLPSDLLKYQISDKMCATYYGSPIGQQLPGSGILYRKDSFGVPNVYLEAITSVGKDQSKSPTSNNILIATKIVDYKTFIEKYYKQ